MSTKQTQPTPPNSHKSSNQVDREALKNAHVLLSSFISILLIMPQPRPAVRVKLS